MQQSPLVDGPVADAAPIAAPTQDIDDFIYLMSHDVRASVRALLELPQWIAEDLSDAGISVTGSVAQSIDLMNRHTARLDRMLADLLAYSRVGRMQETREVDFSAALDEVLGAVKLPEGFRLIRHFGCARGVMGEQDILTLWSALISNAVKHHDRDTGKIAVQTMQEGEMIRFTVMDDGPGIEEPMRARALEAMTTLRPRDEVEGTGMGLANVRKMASHYGGSITLSAARPDGRGLRVDLLLPANIVPD
ncbi:HAMP domain-containing histidine kinase [Sulfitobacter albidus]|uniref:histidine kinase n=1 Tax=Sulfitobacter albidus TaxID=2829501 RepID=A0A975JBX2_9RHOB|nr:HAMP domain-containing sensor histidine kinase [Sulfitobacter albidus]QUJ75522.1 HAMP domain-containing histidine kinase [Sulfitobacter albidus]